MGTYHRLYGKTHRPQSQSSEIHQFFHQSGLLQRETLFGIDRASRQRNADYFIIVEGAPDVLRMQSVGFDNTVAALGTAWTDSQFEQLKKYTSSLCFIPDSDVTEGKPYGAGFEAVMANGAMAIRKGFHVTVRELPFVKASVVGENIPSEDTFQVKFVKNDADSFIKSKEDYTSLAEKHFIIWLAQKRFSCRFFIGGRAEMRGRNSRPDALCKGSACL